MSIQQILAKSDITQTTGIKTTTMSTSMSAGNIEFLPLEGNMVRGCPGKRLLSLVILPNVEARARDPLRGELEEDRDWDCLCKLDINLCAKAFKTFQEKYNAEITNEFIQIIW